MFLQLKKHLKINNNPQNCCAVALKANIYFPYSLKTQRTLAAC